MRRPVIGGAVLLAVTVAYLPMSAQLPAPAQSQRPVFRSDAHFVLVDTYPLKDGKVVEGLTASDFSVLEDGVPQQVEWFEFVDGRVAEPETSRRDPNTVAESREAAADPRARAFVAYLDIRHVTTAGAHRSRVPLVELLNRIIAPNDVFGVMSSEHDVARLTFARRVTGVEDMLARYWSWGLRDRDTRTADEDGLWSCFAFKDPPADPEPRLIADGPRMRNIADLLIDRLREDVLLAHLEDLVWSLGRVREGRTAVILFTEGWRLFLPDIPLVAQVEKTGQERPSVGTRGGQFALFNTVAQGQRQACILEGSRLARANHRQRFLDLITLANSMNVTFFPVNPVGLTAMDTSIAEPVILSGTGSVMSDEFTRLNDRKDAMLTLAVNTDGTAVVNTNDLRAGLRTVVDHLRSFYLLGYHSTNTKFDGLPRRITVTTTVPGVEVKARRSYRAPTEAEREARANPVAAAGPTDVERALDVLAGLRAADDRTFNGARYLKADAAPLLGLPAVFRANPGPRSPRAPVTAPAFRRSERLHIEWPVTQALSGRTARVLGRDGQPLAVQVTLSEQDGASGPLLVADALLAPLAPGDYVVELVVTAGDVTRRTLIAFRVVP